MDKRTSLPLRSFPRKQFIEILLKETFQIMVSGRRVFFFSRSPLRGVIFSYFFLYFFQCSRSCLQFGNNNNSNNKKNENDDKTSETEFVLVIISNSKKDMACTWHCWQGKNYLQSISNSESGYWKKKKHSCCVFWDDCVRGNSITTSCKCFKGAVQITYLAFFKRAKNRHCKGSFSLFV